MSIGWPIDAAVRHGFQETADSSADLPLSAAGRHGWFPPRFHGLRFHHRLLLAGKPRFLNPRHQAACARRESAKSATARSAAFLHHGDVAGPGQPALN